MSLYLKYRPKEFIDVIGQSHIIDILLAQSQAKTFSHNYLLYGPRGTWKTTTARLLAKIANAEGANLADDPHALLIDGWQTLDFVEIDAASHTWVDNIREEIIDKALYPPTQLKKKVYVIDEVHMLSKWAFNALLKIMEEPPSYLMFVLATTEINKVPDTIVSRCQVFNFKRIWIDPIVQRLKYIAQQENITYEEEGLRLIAKLSSWALRDAIKFLEQVSLLWKVTAENASKFLGVVSDSVIEWFIQHILDREYDKVCVAVDELYDWGTDLSHFTKDILLWLDEHFMENPAVYTRLAEYITKIYAQVKKYPYPVLVYKSQLHSYFFAQEEQSAPIKVGESPTELQKPKTKPKTGWDSAPSENKTSVELDTSKDIPSWESMPSPKSSETSEHDLPELMKEIISRVDKIMVKSILKKNAILESLNGDVLSWIVINQQYFTTLQKAEVIVYLQDIVSELRWTPTKIVWKYMTKEDYLQQAMS